MPVDVERHGAVTLARLDRPEALNALSPDLLDALEDALTDAVADPSVRAVVITGAGPKAFSAGADIAHMRTATPAEAQAFARRGHRLMNLIEGSGTPVLAAVNGYALGGGCELALACDVRIAAEGARIGLPEVTIGVLPGWGGTQRLPRLVGPGMAKEMILSGRHLMADEALAAGLVNRVVPADALMAQALELAGQIASRPAWQVATAKRLIDRAGGDAAAGLAAEIDAFALAFTTPDQREGMDAFFEKRPPRFAGH